MSSVTEWIDQLKGHDDPQAAEQLWNRYFQQLVRLARGKLAARYRRAADEEDIALSAMDSVLRGINERRYPQLHDRSDLWKLLLTIVHRKAIDIADWERRKKRGGGRVHGESILENPGNQSGDGLAGLPALDPSPEFAAIVAEQFAKLLDRLTDETLREIAVWKLEGWTNLEIAQKLARTERTIERKVQLIRKTWEQP